MPPPELSSRLIGSVTDAIHAILGLPAQEAVSPTPADKDRVLTRAVTKDFADEIFDYFRVSYDEITRDHYPTCQEGLDEFEELRDDAESRYVNALKDILRASAPPLN